MLLRGMQTIRKIKEKILAFFGFIAGMGGFIGLMGWCCTPLLIGFFALFGISSTAFLMTYNWLFLLISVVSLSLAGIFYLNKIKNKTKCCKK
jgi:hypothetical protein